MSVAINSMSLKLKTVLVLVALAVVSAGWFLLVFHPNQAKVAKLHTQVDTERAQVAALEGELRHLQALQRNEPKLRAQLARFATALPTDPGLPQFILQIQDAANKAHVDFLSVTPSLPSAPTSTSAGAGAAAPAAGTPTTNPTTGLQEISVNITTTGKYFTLENFVYRLEHLDRALRVDTFTVSGSSGSGAAASSAGGVAGPQPGSLSVSMKLRMFMSPKPSTTTTTTPTTTKAGA